MEEREDAQGAEGSGFPEEEGQGLVGMCDGLGG
jgi:hypothetical protein